MLDENSAPFIPEISNPLAKYINNAAKTRCTPAKSIRNEKIKTAGKRENKDESDEHGKISYLELQYALDETAGVVRIKPRSFIARVTTLR